MSRADFSARVRKIEIVNRITGDDWKQSIRVVLDEIELSNENLLELRQFRPNEEVLVVLSSVQRGLFDYQEVDTAAPRNRAPVGAPEPPEELAQAVEGDSNFVTVQEGQFTPATNALHSWSFLSD